MQASWLALQLTNLILKCIFVSHLIDIMLIIASYQPVRGYFFFFFGSVSVSYLLETRRGSGSTLSTLLCVCAVEKMAAAHAGAAESQSVRGATSPAGGAAEAAGKDEWIQGRHKR